MKEKIHPTYNVVEAVCVCGHRIMTGTTLSGISVEICENCHPFYTGQQKIVDTEGRVERFNKRYADIAPASKVDVKNKAKEKAADLARQQQRRAAAMASSMPKPKLKSVEPLAKPAPKAEATPTPGPEAHSEPVAE